VQVRAPNDPNARVNFIAEMEELPIETMVPAAKVVINARTGSIVLNQAVTLGPCAIAHGNLSITISSRPVISQPAPFSQGQTVVAQKATSRSTGPGNIINMPASAQLSDVVRALNGLGATPQDLLAILQAIKAQAH
jgi:flagellar P-ring protein precursor FlgI